MIVERSFGIIPIRENGDVLLIRDWHGNWGFPKGHGEPNESPQESAERELGEETGLKIVEWLDSPKLEISYRNKVVRFFPALVSGVVTMQAIEIQDHIWLPVDQLEDKITFKESKDLVKWIPTKQN